MSDTTAASKEHPEAPTVVGLLWNPAAGGNRRRPQLLDRTVEELGVQAYRQAVTPSAISRALAELKAAGVTTLVISGGDGTIQAVLTCLFEERPFGVIPDIILLPSGTTNMDAHDLGLPGNPARALTRLRQAGGDNLTGLTIRERPVLRVAHGDRRLYGFFLGTGLIAEAVAYFQQRIRRWSFLGQAGSLLASLRTLASLLFRRPEPVPMALDWSDGQTRGGGWALVMATSLERVLFRSRPYHDIGTGEARMTAARYPLRRSLWALLRPGRAGEWAEEQGLCSRRVDTLSIELDGDYIVDGETYQAQKSDGPVEVTVAEERVRFRVPPAAGKETARR
jgi:diacylglycerol kinase family enzyme